MREFIRALTICFFLLCTFSSGAYSSDTTIKYAHIAWRTFPPYVWNNPKTNEPEGFRFNQVKAVLEKAGFSPQRVIYKGSPNTQHMKVLADMAKGDIDLYSLPGGVSPNDPNLIRVEHPAFYLKIRAYTLASRQFTINNFDDLKELRFGYFNLEAAAKSPLLEKNTTISRFENKTAFNTYQGLLTALLSGAVDFTLSSIGPFTIHARQQGKLKLLESHELANGSTPSYWVISANGALAGHEEKLSKILEEFDKQGRTNLLFEAAMKDYLNQHHH